MDAPDTETTSPPPEHREKTHVDLISALARVIGQAARFKGDPQGLDKGQQAALARMDPDDMRPHQVAALTRVLIAAGLEPERWQPETWYRWALIAHGIAMTGHDGSTALGEQLCKAQVAESRVTRLLTARDEAFRQLLPRLLRLMAAKEVAPNWRELGELILNESRREQRAEEIRLKIAGRYFSALARAAD